MGKIILRSNIFTLIGVKFIPIHRFMQQTTTLKNLLILLCGGAILASCKNGGLFGKKKYDKSEATGWNYNDKNKGGFQGTKGNEQGLGAGLGVVQGGSVTMGQVDEDVMGEWNNVPRRVSVASFYM